VVALLYSVGAMERVIDAQLAGFWDLWRLSVVEAVAGEDDFAVEVVDADGGGFDCAVVMVVAGVVG
jgi:hypothetical protein